MITLIDLWSAKQATSSNIAKTKTLRIMILMIISVLYINSRKKFLI